MSTHEYTEEELAGLSGEERAAIEADVDETELTATAAPVDLPDDEGDPGEDDPPADKPDGEDESGEDKDKPGEGGETSDETDEGDPDAGGDPDTVKPDGDKPEVDDAGTDGPSAEETKPAEYVDKEETVNPYEYSDQAKEQIKDLRDRLNDGEMSPAEYDEKMDAIKSADYQQRLQESENRRWGNAVNAYLARNEEYQHDTNPVKFAALDGEVRRMAANAEEIAGLNHYQILEKARANVEKAFGIATAESKQEADAGGDKGKKEVPAAKPKPKATVPDTPNLGDVPAAGVEDPKANTSEFAHLDKLTGADLETALEKMTPAQQERYLAGR